jgi:hypothetical protein
MEYMEKGVEKDNVIFILNNSIKAIQKEDVLTLKDLSNRTIHSASIYQDANSIILAVIVYSLSKIIERPKYQEYKELKKFYSIVMKNLEKAAADLKKDNLDEFTKDLASIRESISRISGHLGIYISEVFRKAMINKASRIYEHGISMQQTAEALGISPFELAEYAGRTGISDVELSLTMEIKKRISLARSVFK